MTSLLLQVAYGLGHAMLCWKKAPRPVPLLLVGASVTLPPAWPVRGASPPLLSTIWVMLDTAGLLPENTSNHGIIVVCAEQKLFDLPA